MAAALLPLLAVSVWSAVREHRASTELAQSQLKFAASLLAAHQDRAVQGAEELLGAIVELPELRFAGRARCQSYFEKLRERHPVYTNMGLLGMDGQPLCHALGARGDVSVSDRDYYRQAIAQKRFVMGEPIFGRITGRLAVPFALPVMEGDQVVAVAFVALDLAQADKGLADVQLPPGARVTVADRRGRVLVQFPDESAPLRSTTHAELAEAARTMTPMAGEAVNAAGEARLYAIAPSRPIGDNGGFVVRVGLSRDTLAAAAWERARESLLALLLTMLAAAAAVWWIGGRMIVKPAKQILGTVRRIEQGRLDARVPLHASTRSSTACRRG
ncbi:MAG TPA: hypothetical protein VNV16_15675 [Methylibium sp.]|nr:hypothetical protein [Methylibium sp.]